MDKVKRLVDGWLGNGDAAGSLLTIQQVADILHAHPNSVRRWSDKGILPTYRIGGRLDRRFRREDVQAFLERGSRST